MTDELPPARNGACRAALRRAKENTERWGQQPPGELALAIIEEVGETTDLLGSGGEPLMDAHLREATGNGRAVRRLLERKYEDGGEPLLPGERPRFDPPVEDPDALRDEVIDLMALCVQIDWALWLDEYRGADR